MARMRMNQAVAAAVGDEMREDPDVVMFGEDVAVAGGPFKTSDGLLEEFGPSRVRDTPISEMGFLGMAVGAAASGLRPVAEIMFIEFLGVALDQLVTEAAKFHFLSKGVFTCPLTVRASIGAGLGFGCQHSQTLENWLSNAPGLKMVMVSDPQSAYGLLRSAVRDPNPVVVLEPRALYGGRGQVTTGTDGIIPLGEARRVREGTDVTVVSAGAMVKVALAAAEASDDWSAEVIDIQTLIPWDREGIISAARRTGRLVIVEESPYTSGWGTEIAAYVGARLFGELRAPVLRITCPDVPVPFGRELEQRYMPNPGYVIDQIDQLMATGRAPDPWWAEKGRSLQ
jgi:pyruvate dehydrogenase E1 component beta subunit